jgi:hypothetical protein
MWGKFADLYPSDPWAIRPWTRVEDINGMIVATRFLPDERKKAQRKALI